MGDGQEGPGGSDGIDPVAVRERLHDMRGNLQRGFGYLDIVQRRAGGRLRPEESQWMEQIRTALEALLTDVDAISGQIGE